MKQNKFRSPVLWTTTVTNIATIVGLFCTVDTEPYVKALIIVVGILTQFGILNNPTSKDTL